MTSEERLEKVETQLAHVRWINRCLMSGIALSLALWGLTQTFGPESAGAQSGTKEIRANSFVLEDENGKARAALRMTPVGPSLAFYDETIKPRAGLALTKDHLGLFLYDETGKPRAMLSVNKGRPDLTLYDETGLPRVLLMVGKEGPRLELADGESKLLWKAP